MGFFLQLEIESSLPPREFRERIIVPLEHALEREHLGHVLCDEEEDSERVQGHYDLALEVSDQARAREVVAAVFDAVDG